jgi:hypothetical protein
MEISYHPHGLHALEDWYLAKEKKSIAKLPELSKCVEAILITLPPQKGETPRGRQGVRARVLRHAIPEMRVHHPLHRLEQRLVSLHAAVKQPTTRLLLLDLADR